MLSQKENFLLMAGGTDLLDELKSGAAEAPGVADLKSISGLSYIKKEKGEMHIGALTRVADLAGNRWIKQEYPELVQAALSLSTPQLRNVGTVGGNLCQRPRCWYYRDPQVLCLKKGGNKCFAFGGRNKYHAILGGGPCFIVFPSDLAPVLISLAAEVILSSGEKERTVPLEEFYVLPRENVRKENILRKEEILKEIKFPQKKNSAKGAYQKFKERGTWDFAVVSAAVNGVISENIFQDIRIVLGGVAPIPWRAKRAENMIKGRTATQELLREAAREELKEARPLEENAYKKELVEIVTARTALSLIEKS